MKKQFILLFLIIMPILSCVLTKSDNIRSGHTNLQKGILIGYDDFRLISPLLKKNEIDKEPEEKRTLFTECYDWTFDESSVRNILRKMRQVDSSYAYHVCQYFPCWYTGIVTNGVVDYEITIYAHGAITLENGKKTIFFIMEDESDLFIVPCGNN